VAELTRETGPDWEVRFQPGSFGCHELLDRTALVARMVEESIQSHPACLRNPEWFALADRASAALAELYQRIGEEHLGGGDDEPNGR